MLFLWIFGFMFPICSPYVPHMFPTMVFKEVCIITEKNSLEICLTIESNITEGYHATKSDMYEIYILTESRIIEVYIR